MLYLVRHGQTEANAAGLIQGQRDFELNATGRLQAATLAKAVPADAPVISSPLRRARQTAAALAGDREVAVDERWMEMDFGDLDGRPVADVRALLWTNWGADPEWAPAGGESLASVSRRVATACDELLPRFAAGPVIVVTHVSPIKAAVTWALAVGPAVAGRLFVGEASVTAIAAGHNGVPVLRSFSDRSHLV